MNYAACVQGGDDPSDGAALIMCPHPFGQWSAVGHGGREYRGLRTQRYTYTRSLQGPWLLYDNLADPYQLQNLVDRPEQAETVRELDAWLQRRLDAMGDEFLPGSAYLEQWGWEVDETGTVRWSW